MKNDQRCIDYNHDGKINSEDIEINKQLLDMRVRFDKDRNQVKLAWVAMISMIIVTGLLFTPIVTEGRITAIQDILDVFYVTQASVIGFYVGANTYLNRNVKNINKTKNTTTNYDNEYNEYQCK